MENLIAKSLATLSFCSLLIIRFRIDGETFQSPSNYGDLKFSFETKWMVIQ